MLKNFLNNTAPQDQTLKLYTSNTTPAEGDTAATYTEASGGGYAAKSLTGSSWTVSTAAGTTEGSYAQQTWTFTSVPGTPDMYGYFVVQTTSGILMWAERFTGAPYTIVNVNDQINVTPKIQAA